MNQVLNRRHLLQLAAAAGLPAGQLAWAEKTTDQQTAPTADQALEILMEGNARYVNGDMDVRDFYPNRQTLASGQSPHSAILACSDSRVAPELVFDQSRGDLFVVRVAGNFVNQDGLASLEFTTKVLGTPLIMVMGHTQCGAVAATIDVVKNHTQLPGHLPEMIRAIKPAVEKTRNQTGDRLLNTIKANVVVNVNKLKTAQPIIAELVEQKKVKIVGALYHLKTGKVELIG
ncbi:MAG: carbonic anhydrase [Pirellulales bacterium]|nr:carbonic anhydrase [Pirellulales bacterium]